MLGKTVGGVFTLRVVLGRPHSDLRSMAERLRSGVADREPSIDDVRPRPDSRVRLGGAAARCLENSG